MKRYVTGSARSGSTPEPPRVAGAESLHALLDAVVADWGLSEKLLESKVLLAWEQAAGPLANHARPLRIRHGKLEIAVPSSVWRTQINFVKQEIIDRINASVGKEIVESLVLLNTQQ